MTAVTNTATQVIGMKKQLFALVIISLSIISCSNNSKEASESTISSPSSSTTESVKPDALNSPKLFKKYRYAVAEVKTENCEGKNGGTAFFISETIAITAFHVVEEANSIVLWLENDGRGKVLGKRTPRRKVHARLIYGSEQTDLAVLQVPERTTQHISFIPFGLKKEMPKVGEEVAVFGYPNSEFIFSPGQVIATNVIKEKPYYPLIITDAYSGPGGSGGPLVTAYGDAIGVTAGGRNSGSSYIHSLFHTELWNPIDKALNKAKSEPYVPPPEYFCVGPIDLKAAHDDVWENDLPETGPLNDIKATYALWLLGINSGNEELAFQALSAKFASKTTIDSWVEAHSSTLINDFHIFDLDNSVPGELRVTVRFTSTQSDEHARIPGENCTKWVIRHTLVPGTITSSKDSSQHMSLWKIDKSESRFWFSQEI
jgi:V8-like Glu-specific endopeptidase